MRIEKNYDFLKDFRDNWLFYIDWAPKSEKRSFSIAFNGFSDDEKKEL